MFDQRQQALNSPPLTVTDKGDFDAPWPEGFFEERDSELVLIMLSIFAIDPKICENLDWFRYCTEHCQPSQGRVIADLPSGQWYENANTILDQHVQALNLPPIKVRSLKSCLDMVRGQLVDRPGNIWTDWYYDDFSRFSCDY